MKHRLYYCSAFLFLLSMSPLASADADDLAELRTRLSEIQKENEELRARVDEQARFIDELAGTIERLSRAAGAESPPSESQVRAAEPATDEPIEAPGSPLPQLSIHGFADTSFFAQSAKSERQGSENAFSFNELDLLLTSQIADELSVLSEIVFHFDEIEEDAFFEVERIYLKYSPSSLINVKLGRVHTPLGYWNQNYHHGSWFQTTVNRPEIFRFEDDGGILPTHSVGVELYGTQPVSGLELDYSVGVFNGRGATLDEVQNVRDLNRSKAVNFRLFVLPAAVPGLQVGITTYLDEFPEVRERPFGRGPIGEQIVGGHLVYTRESSELLAELLRVRHRDDERRETFTSDGLYVQAGYQMNRWKPYYRFDLLNIDEADPLFAPFRQDLRRHTIGSRWDVSTWLAVKFEYAYEHRPLFHFHTGGLQAAFSF